VIGSGRSLVAAGFGTGPADFIVTGVIFACAVAALVVMALRRSRSRR
jgi:hypothetical protein